MRIVDSHFHWYPRAVLEKLAKRTSGFPRAVLNGDTGDFKIESGLEVPISAASARPLGSATDANAPRAPAAKTARRLIVMLESVTNASLTVCHSRRSVQGG